MDTPRSFFPRTLSRFGGFVDQAVFPLAATATSACGLLILLLGLWILVGAPTYVRGVECNVLFTIQKTLSGQPLYTNPNDLPYDVAQYSPFYYQVCILISQVLNISPSNPWAISAVARSVSFVCSLLIAWVVYRLQVTTLRVNRCFAVVATAFAFASCSPWLFLARPDALMYLMLISSIAALLQTQRTTGVRSGTWLVTSAILALAALATKQNGAIAPVILLVTLAVSGRGRDFLIVSTVMTLIGAIFAVVAFGAWPFIIQNVIDGVNNGVSLHAAIEKTYARTFSNFAFPLAAGFVAAIKWARMPPTDRTLAHTALLVAILVTFTAAVVSGIKIGSAEGYFNETILFVSIAVSWFLSSRAPDCEDVLIKAVACFLLVFLPFWTGKQLLDYYVAKVYVGESGTIPSLVHPESAFTTSEYRTVAAFIRREMEDHPKGFVISWSQPMNNFLPEYCILPQKEVVGLMQKQNVIDLAPLERSIRRGQLKYGISRDDVIPNDILGIPLPPSKVVFQDGELRVFQFSGE